MSKPIWKLEPLAKPSAAHAADAVEIVAGEAVRRVTLPQLDYDIYLQHSAIHKRVKREPHSREVARELSLPLEEVEAGLRRLAAAGLISPPERTVLQ